MKKPLHIPPQEIVKAEALPVEKRRANRNHHHQGNGYSAMYKEEKIIRQANRSAHRIPPRPTVEERPIFVPKMPANMPVIKNIDRLWEIVTGQFPSSLTFLHGPEHWRRVEANALKLSCRTGADTVVIRLFALFHDSRRVSELDDQGHGARGAEYAASLRGVEYQVTDKQFELLEYACIWHTEGVHHDDPTVGTCWDADRLDVGRVNINPDPEFMSTEYGRELASH